MTGLEALQQLRLPDAWQAEAIRALGAGEDVIVQAPTGAGKTFIFEQHFQQKRGPGQVIYTVPTRALANDKFAEWSRQGWRVGITTGDLAYQADAPLVVATLEAQQSPAHAALYVVDEYQWLADPLRGNHYEGTILSLPPQTQLLLLSGSVANPGAVRDWLVRLDRGRKVTLIEQRERPVPLDEVEIEGPSRNVPDAITGYWARRIAGALRDDLGPILVFAPHRKEAEKIARDVAARIPCPQPLRLTKDQENAAGPDLGKLLGQRVAFHHSGLSYVQRAGLVEPLAKGGQLRVVVATLGLSAGINFSLRSVLVTATSFTAGGLPREVTPPELLQMFGRAGRRGLDDQGYVLVSERSPRLGQARAGHLRRGAPLPWRPLLQSLAKGGPIEQVSADFQRRLFTTEFIPLGIESTQKIHDPLPCGLRTDPGRARLVRRTNDPAPFCFTCPHREECLALDPKPTLLWLWNRTGILDKHLQLTRRGRIMACFSGAEGLGVLAGLEDEKYPLNDLIEDMANLVAGDRFCGTEPRWGGRLAHACQKAYRRFTSDGFLTDGMPVNYGAGGAEIVRSLRQKNYVPMQNLEEHVHRGDIDRLLIEWKSLLRQIAGATIDDSWPRWTEFQALCRAEVAQYERTSLPGLPVIAAEQMKPVNHRLSMSNMR
ncbi:MAG TPA: DEAD/DEAH box helicase [Candidatus Methylacidiphilales bacterium]|jgi:superfamily II DNA/RNA helicase|nr:DEAD/DEAH box helicase [Candidatus Methylacidiphilales bacterium]